MDNNELANELVKLASELVSEDESKGNRQAAGNLMDVADMFTRFLIGDREGAIRQLSTIKGKDFAGELGKLETEEINELYQKIYNDIFRAIKKNLPV